MNSLPKGSQTTWFMEVINPDKYNHIFFSGLNMPSCCMCLFLLPPTSSSSTCWYFFTLRRESAFGLRSGARWAWAGMLEAGWRIVHTCMAGRYMQVLKNMYHYSCIPTCLCWRILISKKMQTNIDESHKMNTTLYIFYLIMITEQIKHLKIHNYKLW